jgi:hypothetical protein
MITTTNIGITNSLLQNYCRIQNIPIYLIINGLLGGDYLDEAKDATWINSYGESIKKNYFKEMDNILCLGDPRMDEYQTADNKPINYTNPTIVVGAAGFSNINLNSYVAFEYDFINDVAYACRQLIENGNKMDLIVKVRSNGYIDQYISFFSEYYPDLTVTLYDSISMHNVLLNADFYISIYSQTLFEASCMGVPALYYKKDTELRDPPFDGNSELITALSQQDLIDKIELFYQKSSIYEAFKQRKIMEKYIGPLDGKNIDRNMDFIYSLVSQT